YHSLRGRIESAKLASDVIKGEGVRVPHVPTISSHRSHFLPVGSWTVRQAPLYSPQRHCGRLWWYGLVAALSLPDTALSCPPQSVFRRTHTRAIRQLTVWQAYS